MEDELVTDEMLLDGEFLVALSRIDKERFIRTYKERHKGVGPSEALVEGQFQWALKWFEKHPEHMDTGEPFIRG
jgi:hypothetical protein